MTPFDQRWSIPQAAALATVLEASAPKVGNVHPNASFSDMHFGHFIASALAVEDAFRQATSTSVGQLVFDAVAATRKRVGRNTNLGTVLLLAPLAAAARCLQSEADDEASAQLRRSQLRRQVIAVLNRLSAEDSRLVYAAIRLAAPGGMGTQTENDVTAAAPADLRSAMQQVAEIDAVAAQYVNGFEDLFQTWLPWLDSELANSKCPTDAIVKLQLRCLAWKPDGLIARKCGMDQARHVQAMARYWWEQSHQCASNWLETLRPLDEYLRQEGHRRNPGTTADLIAATIFVRLIATDSD